VTDLGNQLALLPAGSISRLVIGGHGSPDGPKFDANDNNRFNADQVSKAGADTIQKIKTALAANALIDLQACACAFGQTGIDNMQFLANTFSARVRGAKDCIADWDDTSTEWVTVSPQ